MPNTSKQFIALGTMTGTSMDGIDVAAIATDGKHQLRSLGHVHLPYTLAFQKRLRAAEREAHQACGLWQDADVVLELSQLHIVALDRLLDQLALDKTDIDVIGFHGQTLYHNPMQKISLQVGDATLLAAHFGVPIIEQFRMADVNAGGQGAPLAPVYHQALVLRDQLAPAAVINCGGIANISLVTGEGWEQVFACDVGPGNVLLDRFVREASHGVKAYDENGAWAAQGCVSEDYLAALKTANDCDITGPISLDSYDFTLPPVGALDRFTVCATLAYYTASTIAYELIKACQRENVTFQHVVLCGGGWHNPSIESAFKALLPSHIKVRNAAEVGWCSDAVEAETFAYLAVRRILALPASGPNTTGVAMPMLAGSMR